MTSIKGQQRKHVEHANKHIDTCKQQQNTLQPILSTDLTTDLARSDNGAWTSCRISLFVNNTIENIDKVEIEQDSWLEFAAEECNGVSGV